jgi:hypothetical protein
METHQKNNKIKGTLVIYSLRFQISMSRHVQKGIIKLLITLRKLRKCDANGKTVADKKKFGKSGTLISLRFSWIIF